MTTYKLDWAPKAREHLKAFSKSEQVTIVKTIRKKLQHEPAVIARNRFPMGANPLAGWELRIDPFRVYYDIEDDPEPVVKVIAIGVKVRARVYIAGELVEDL